MKVVNSCFQQIHPFYNETNSSRQIIYTTRATETEKGQWSRIESPPQKNSCDVKALGHCQN